MLSPDEIDAIEASIATYCRRLTGDPLFFAAAFVDKNPTATPRDVAQYLRVPVGRVLKSWGVILSMDPAEGMPSKEYQLYTVSGNTVLTIRRRAKAANTARPVFSRERGHGNKTTAEIHRARAHTANGG